MGGMPHHSRPPQTDSGQVFPAPSSNPSLGPPRDPTTIRLGNRGPENGSLNRPPPSGTPSPIKEKKQLSDKHTARKSVKPSILGQTYIVSPVSPVRGPSIDTQSTNPRPAKKQRLSTSSVPNVSELYSRSNSSSFSENGMPQSSKRGMFRQSEERTYKLSAVDDFALRPKKKEAVNETARPKIYNGQRQLHRGESHFSSSSRQTPPSSKPPQTTGLNGSTRSGPNVIDLTLDDDLEPQLPHLKPQISPKTHAPNGINTTSHQYPRKLSGGNPVPSHEPRISVALDDKQRRDVPSQPQPGGVPQPQHGRFVAESSNPRTQKPLENIVPSAPTVQTTLKPANGTPSETPISKQMPHSTALKKGTGPVHNSFPRSSTHQEDATHAKESQIVNETRHFTPINSPQGALQLEQMKTRRIAKSTARAEPIPAIPVTTQLEAPGVAAPRQTNGIHRPVKSVEKAPPPPVSEPQPVAVSQGPLSALLGGRVWKNMSPEERRLFWVSQHDPEKFDAQIYSENNRPFRPGDPLFGLPDDALPPRPKRPAVHFDYINPRTHYSRRLSEACYTKKQKEISARGNRKTHFGQASSTARAGQPQVASSTRGAGED
ncbi:hypothetical protein O1611_g8177 [Lasiodiplodia mahajangana]|uniref:Uncharacterized protein n=1 Tax=Lasiodiplodia mahajangana TaxID=1108764 RepID=A0ACC2JD69_9PEZI|nr:hypothetical protein O1611_g8177 [Lasiodiplodia mahajangana]